MKPSIRVFTLAVTLGVMCSTLASAQSTKAAKPPRPVEGAPAAAATSVPAASPTPTPTAPKVQRSEVITVGNWTVTCAEADESKAKPRCVAVLKIAQDQNGVQRVVFTWTIGVQGGKTVSAVSIPPGILIAPGVSLKVGTGEARKFGFALCQPDHCEAVVPMDEALVRELSAAATAEVSVVAVNGSIAKFNVNLSGFEQALTELAK